MAAVLIQTILEAETLEEVETLAEVEVLFVVMVEETTTSHKRLLLHKHQLFVKSATRRDMVLLHAVIVRIIPTNQMICPQHSLP